LYHLTGEFHQHRVIFLRAKHIVQFRVGDGVCPL
jgi:hypothetical protein